MGNWICTWWQISGATSACCDSILRVHNIISQIRVNICNLKGHRFSNNLASWVVNRVDNAFSRGLLVFSKAWMLITSHFIFLIMLQNRNSVILRSAANLGFKGPTLCSLSDLYFSLQTPVAQASLMRHLKDSIDPQKTVLPSGYLLV